jgi:NAD(P)-dependent dehydrogenase (short-subunit alcohol dehydrogenase family)
MDSPPLAMVTGGAHRLGEAFARALAHAGFAIVLHYWNSASDAGLTAEELRASGTQVFLVRADLTDPAAIQHMFHEVDGIPLALRVLVNSAGMLQSGDSRALGPDAWDATMDLNLRAPFLCAQEAAGRMAPGGLIVNITDVGARKSWSRFPAYTVSKAGLESLTRVLARAYAPNIRVNAIAPGLVLRSEETRVSEWGRLVERLPLKRSGTADEVAEALLFLLKNQYVTGQTLAVDGGYALLG